MRRTAALIVSGALTLTFPAVAGARSDVVRAGLARFEVITPTLIRLEYARDGRFERARTMTTLGEARSAPPAFEAVRSGGWLTIRTARMRLRYRLASGPFSAANLRLRLGASRASIRPTAANGAGNLGGWRRALDLLSGPVRLNDGVLSRAGWYVLDDTSTALITAAPPGFAARPAHRGPYQDWYLFAYGHDYTRALMDLRALTGPSPLLPRTAFGVWFSRYWPYSEDDYRALIAQFRSNRIPLDTLSVDTDFKREASPIGAAAAAIVAGAPGRPYSWNGWVWNTSLFPDPAGFLRWAHGQGLSVALNIHPSITSDDPQYPATSAAGGPLRISSGQCRILIADPTGQCAVFDWTKARQIDAYFALHRDFERDGADLFWFDWCCDDSSAVAPGLTADTWINSLYAREQRSRGSRWPAFARVGASYNATDGFDGDTQSGGTGIFAEHRYTIQFTGDTCATWQMLAFEARFTSAEAGIGLPYVSHDIGSFNGQPVQGRCGPLGTSALSAHLPDDLYARWVAFGSFQPLDRLHSNHGDRLPWEYDAAADTAASGFLRLREALVPYVYTAARRSYDDGLPISGPLYLQWPRQADAYRHPSEYTFGPDMVVEPVTAPGDPAPAAVWIPPGTWVDYFTGQRFRGPGVRTLSVPLSQMPVLVRAGAILPTEPYAPYTPSGSPKTVIVTAYPGPRGRSALYDDQGVGFGYARGAFMWTQIAQERRGRRTTVTIGGARGSFPGAPASRRWVVRISGVVRPRRVTVDGQPVRRWSYDRLARTLTVDAGAQPTARSTTVSAR